MLAGLAVCANAGPVSLTQDFSSDPIAAGWRVFGETNLFFWDRTNQNLRVTWDSSQTNSYFFLPLGVMVTRDDDFQLGFDLSFEDYQSGTTPGKPYAFPAAIGFLNLNQAAQTNFSRGVGINATYGAKNLVEFDFFPAFDIYSPTIAQVVVSTNNAWLYNHLNLLEMPPGDLFRIAMNYDSATHTLTTATTRNGLPYGQLQTIVVNSNYDFRVNAVSVSSYSDQHADGSMLAHGVLDNIVVTVPPPPVQNFSGNFTNGSWQAHFISQSNWLYQLERTVDFQSWTTVGGATPGNATNLFLLDESAIADKAFYRVKAERP
jgi:hypothetical protein